jgi:hypothetical protein
MPRSPIRNKDKDVITDDGAVLISVAKGEQIHLTFTCTSETDLTGYTLTAKVAEGANQPGDLEEVPFQEDASTPAVTTLPIIDADASDNTFIVVIPDDLCDTWAVQPTPDDPVYGFFALQVADTGVGDAQQIRVPVRGLIEVRYNPVESGA